MADGPLIALAVASAKAGLMEEIKFSSLGLVSNTDLEAVLLRQMCSHVRAIHMDSLKIHFVNNLSSCQLKSHIVCSGLDCFICMERVRVRSQFSRS